MFWLDSLQIWLVSFVVIFYLDLVFPSFRDLTSMELIAKLYLLFEIFGLVIYER